MKLKIDVRELILPLFWLFFLLVTKTDKEENMKFQESQQNIQTVEDRTEVKKITQVMPAVYFPEADVVHYAAAGNKK